jgi:hypothetical protein
MRCSSGPITLGRVPQGVKRDPQQHPGPPGKQPACFGCFRSCRVIRDVQTLRLLITDLRRSLLIEREPRNRGNRCYDLERAVR